MILIYQTSSANVSRHAGEKVENPYAHTCEERELAEMQSVWLTGGHL